MKILRAVDFSYTLYEENDGTYILDLIIPSAESAWASYEKRVVVRGWDKVLIKTFPNSIDRIVNKLIEKEKLEH